MVNMRTPINYKSKNGIGGDGRDDSDVDCICWVCVNMCVCVNLCMNVRVGRKKEQEKEKGREGKRDVIWQMSFSHWRGAGIAENAGSDGTSPISHLVLTFLGNMRNQDL